MKSTRWIVVALVVALCLALVPLALARSGGGGAKGKVKFEAVGKVTAVDGTAMTLTVKVKAGTKTIKALRGTEVPMTVASTAKVRVAIAHKWLRGATLADVAVGARVKVRGTISIDSSDPANPVKVFTVKNVKAWQPTAVAPVGGSVASPACDPAGRRPSASCARPDRCCSWTRRRRPPGTLRWLPSPPSFR